MKIQIDSTSKVVQLQMPDGSKVPARIWEGHTESGIPVHCYVTRIAVEKSEDSSQFEAELLEQRAPSSSVSSIPLHLIL